VRRAWDEQVRAQLLKRRVCARISAVSLRSGEPIAHAAPTVLALAPLAVFWLLRRRLLQRTL